MSYKPTAILTLKDVPEMTRAQRRNIAAWLRKQADFLENADPLKIASLYRARYFR